MSFINTSPLAVRTPEQLSGPRLYVNNLEVQVIRGVLQRLLDIAQGTVLHNQIAIIAPYRSQVEAITESLRDVRQLRNQPVRRAYNITVSTVDAMQGSQRNIVIFSATRSNLRNEVGFVSDLRRLNVSVSRARYLNIIIADSDTFIDTPPILSMYKNCSNAAYGSGLYRLQSRRNRVDGLDFTIELCSPQLSMDTRSTNRSRDTVLQVQEAKLDFDYSAFVP